MDYDLSRLGDKGFEDLTQALALRILGSGVKVFGFGPDGGREAEFEGTLEYPDPSAEGCWSGYVILQAKYKNDPADTKHNLRWLKAALKQELDKWSERAEGLESLTRQRKLERFSKAEGAAAVGRIPDYIIFATNVALSGVPGRGGIDVIDDLISGYAAQLKLKGWHIWHYDQICRYLDSFPEIRRTYAASITPGDVMATFDRTGTATDRTGTATIALPWSRLGDDGFERLLYDLLRDFPDHQNVQWLMQTRASDRGRDLSLDRVLRDSTGGVRTERVIVQAKHWLKKSVGPADVAATLASIKLWQPPVVRGLIIATSGRFTADAVAYAERHNYDGTMLPLIDLWPESKLETLLAQKPYLAAAHGLR